MLSVFSSHYYHPVITTSILLANMSIQLYSLNAKKKNRLVNVKFVRLFTQFYSAIYKERIFIISYAIILITNLLLPFTKP